MPLIFIHGVNNRDGAPYQSDVASRDLLLRRFLLPGMTGAADMAIVNPYWGDLGAAFAWGLRSVPGMKQGLEAAMVGNPSQQSRTPLADAEFAALSQPPTTTYREEAAGGSESTPALPLSLRQLATDDLPTLMEAMLGAIAHEEWSLQPAVADTAASDEESARQGICEALLIIAGDEAAHDPQLIATLRRVQSDDQALSVIKDAVIHRYRQLLRSSDAAPSAAASPQVTASGLESVMLPRWISDRIDQAEDLFDRARGAVARAAGLSIARVGRAGAHQHAARFLGDVFVYLQHRGSLKRPGPIVRRVLGAIRKAVADAPGEPLVVITHSMGGNIFYDILTCFAPDLAVDAWVSVGGQVAQFEESKLFKASDRGLRYPAQVASLQPRVKRWLNIYDPADVFSFLAEPVFRDVQDRPYNTGAGLVSAHGTYFKRASFYRLLREELGNT